LQDLSGNTYDGYQLIFNSGRINDPDFGIRATIGAGNVGVGFQYYENGAWKTTVNTYASYLSGVNSTAGVNTATLYGYVENSPGVEPRDMGILFRKVPRLAILISGEGKIVSSPIGAEINFQCMCADYFTIAPSGIGYTSIGWAGSGSHTAKATGLRIVPTAGGAIDLNSEGYVAVYGIPNA